MSEPRQPVVVIMGHIDHGKSSLLDYIRSSNVVANEAGGITQAVSAYEVELPGDGPVKKLTFIDTPGHAAFADMRERGAQLADIAILVISAEEGPKPQTLEALKAIRAAKLPFIVAINKIDRPAANAERTKQQLAENDLLVEGYGGQTPVAEISAKTGAGVPELLELVRLAAELENFTADPSAPARGFILESDRNPKSGITATLIIKEGTLHLGDWLSAGATGTRVKRLSDWHGRATKLISAGAPAIIGGWESLPAVGAPVQVWPDKKAAEQAAGDFKLKNKMVGAPTATTDAKVEIPLLLKTAAAGQGDALAREIAPLATPAVAFKWLANGVGAINEADVKLAGATAGAVILGFGVEADKATKDLAEKLKVEIQSSPIIYKLSEWLALEIARRTPRVTVEEFVGRAKLLKIFGEQGNKQIVGGVVTQGRLLPDRPCKIIRREQELGRGRLVGLQQQKIAVKEVPADSQFGALLETKITPAVGDVLELFEAHEL